MTSPNRIEKSMLERRLGYEFCPVTVKERTETRFFEDSEDSQDMQDIYYCRIEGKVKSLVKPCPMSYAENCHIYKKKLEDNKKEEERRKKEAEEDRKRGPHINFW